MSLGLARSRLWGHRRAAILFVLTETAWRELRQPVCEAAIASAQAATRLSARPSALNSARDHLNQLLAVVQSLRYFVRFRRLHLVHAPVAHPPECPDT